MRKPLAVTLVSILALLFTSVGAVAAQPNETEPFVCKQDITFDLSLPDPHWIGKLTECDLEGKVEFWETSQNYVVGKTEHFFEIFKITTATGVINGVDDGVWNFPTFKFRANGWVTDASGDWTYLVGYKVHEIGTTSEFPPPAGSTVVTGTGTMTLVAP